MIVAMVVLGGIGHMPGVILGAVLLSALPEVLRYVAGPLQADDRRPARRAILRQLLIALAMIVDHAAAAARPVAVAGTRQGACRCRADRAPSAEHGSRTAAVTASRRRRQRHEQRHRSSRRRRLQALRRPAGAVRRRHHDRAGPGLRPDRPERRRQDDLLQRHHRPVHARQRHLRARRQAVRADARCTRWRRPASRAPSRTSACSPR